MKGVYPNEILTIARVVGVGGMVYMGVSIVRKIRARARAFESSDPEALDELWGRFERGEISWEEYEAASRDLER